MPRLFLKKERIMTNKNKDIICSVLFLAFGAAMFILASGLKNTIRNDVGPGYVPKFIGVCMMIVSGAKLILSLFDKSKTGKAVEKMNGDIVGGLGTVGLMVAYAWAFAKVGFIVSSAVYLFCQILLMSNEKNRKPVLFAAISILLPVAVDALFVFLIQTPLPKGILGF